MARLQEPKHIRFTEAEEAKIKKLAEEAERTFAAEVRLAVRHWIEKKR